MFLKHTWKPMPRSVLKLNNADRGGGFVNYLCQGTIFRVWIADKNGLGLVIDQMFDTCWINSFSTCEEGDDGLSKCTHFHEMDQTRNLYAINTCKHHHLVCIYSCKDHQNNQMILGTVSWMHIIGLHENWTTKPSKHIRNIKLKCTKYYLKWIIEP